jgi:lysosomal Pro-X carboxypeptidase
MFPTPGTQNCTLNWYEQHVDHFDFDNNNTYLQRYYSYSDYWKPGNPIFFYLGNEADVTLYVNATGLMWENAENFGALLIFAEHRYYGKSIPSKELRFLTHEQALADYATLVHHIKKRLNTYSSAVIGFGGSYGGMLAAWARQKYPASFDGVIAASAPILAFNLDEKYSAKLPGMDSYWKVVSDCTSADFGT